MKRLFIHRFIAAAMFISAAGSASAAKITLRFEGASRVDLTEAQDAWLKGMSATSRDAIRLDLSTDRNVRDTVVEKHLNASVEARFCDRNHENLGAIPGVFDRQGRITYRSGSSHNSEDRRVSVFVFLRQDDFSTTPTDAAQHSRYDLTHSDRDVCVVVSGRNMALQGFTSKARIAGKVLRESISQ